MNSYTHDPIALMSREESLENEERHKQEEYQASLIECACGGKFEPWQMTQIGGVNHCPACVEVYKEQNDGDDGIVEEVLASVLSTPRLEKLKWSLALMYIRVDASDSDLVWLANRVDGAIKLNADPNRLPF